MNDADRIAVVVVHGIADQQPGQTVREVARLLCHGGESEPRYVQGEMHDVLVPVKKLEPGPPAQAGQPSQLSAPRQKKSTAIVPAPRAGFSRPSNSRRLR